ncbi:hypothetical protein Q9S78_09385 [Microbacterium sp. KSW-18]|uniref:Uncharacterized protein n=1 Tax=Microbacterium aquilitoris TaxID=3067307 RepID=A0ABU3GKJ7_9MICO|nr:hypothetical protein [Microbacterium sp. KSW-18]MDT3330885.1 hypothetical protein [Microbacterium sp. KSW-18]
MTDPIDDPTRRADRADRRGGTRVPDSEPDDLTLFAARRVPDDETLLAARRADDDTRLAERRADETLVAERRTGEGTRVTERRVVRDAGSPAVAHGRADTPRTASSPGTLVSGAVYAPRRSEPAPQVVRAPLSPPTGPDRRTRRRARRGGVVAVVIGGAAVVAGAVWGIIVIVQGGM